MSAYVLHPAALQDLQNVWDYIAQDSPTAATQTVESIEQAIRLIATAPYTGHQRADIARRPLRFWPVGEYLIAYVPDHDPVAILAVIHGRRSPRKIARLLRSRVTE